MDGGPVRRPLTPLPTPLEPAPRFSEAVGAEVWIKRDDIGSIGMAGNKVRKLEYLVAAALEEGADTLVTLGAVASNAARATAAAAARSGLRCVLVLGGDAPDVPSGNVLLDGLFGAEVRFVPTAGWDALDRALAATAAEIEAAGGRPYVMPVGCSSPLGAVGFVAAHAELAHQLADAGVAAEAAYHASSSGGTHAGLILGRLLAGGGPEIRAIGVGEIYNDMAAAYLAIARGAASLLGASVALAPDDVRLDMAHMGPAYGVPTPAALEAIDLMARLEGIVCDPVYSGKGLGALVTDARAGRIRGPVVFWHTGGAQSVFDPQVAAPLWAAIGGGPPFPWAAAPAQASAGRTSRTGQGA
jgi:D-cysteine desulfhydrase family pyridoxal phosphate-dependent enzyme